MENTTYSKSDYLLRKLPIFIGVLMLTLMPMLKSNESALPLIVILSLLSLSILATIYRIRVKDYKKNIDPKRFLILSVCTAVLLFVSMYFGFTALGWMVM